MISNEARSITISILLNIMFCTDGKISVRINLPLFSTVVPSNRLNDGGKKVN